jgi:hypothetical protein
MPRQRREKDVPSLVIDQVNGHSDLASQFAGH